MTKLSKTYFQDIHYLRQKPSFCLKGALAIAEFFYKNIIKIKNFLYEKKVLKEKKTGAYVFCVGNLTTGGVGKTPIVIRLANELSKEKPTAIISRGYGSKISSKTPVVVKDFKEIKFKDGTICGDEPFQTAMKADKNVVVIISKDRKKAIELAIVKYGIQTVVLDDGFSNRKIKKDKTILVADSKMLFGNKHLLPYGPLREPIEEVKRADEIILVDKENGNIKDAVSFLRHFNKPIKVCKMRPKRIYNIKTKADVVFNKPLNTLNDDNYKPKAVAFCAIGQPVQFFNFAKQFYDIVEEVSFCDHHKYDKNDIKNLTEIADKNAVNIFITTQKDETKLLPLIENGYNFNALELDEEFSDIFD